MSALCSDQLKFEDTNMFMFTDIFKLTIINEVFKKMSDHGI